VNKRVEKTEDTEDSAAETVSSREVDDDCSDERQNVTTAYHHRSTAGLTYLLLDERYCVTLALCHCDSVCRLSSGTFMHPSVTLLTELDFSSIFSNHIGKIRPSFKYSSFVPFSSFLTLKNIVTLTYMLEVTQGHRQCYFSCDFFSFSCIYCCDFSNFAGTVSVTVIFSVTHITVHGLFSYSYSYFDFHELHNTAII